MEENYPGTGGGFSSNTVNASAPQAGTHTIVYHDADNPDNWSTLHLHEGVNNNEPISISCTTIIVPPDNMPRRLKSFIFFDLALDQMYLTRRGGVFSVLVGSLLSILHSRVTTSSDPIPHDLVNIISGRQDVDVATIRVPYFSDNMEDPFHGYTPLRSLSDISVQLLPPPLHIDHHRELLAIQDNNPRTAKYAELWGPHGLNPNTHFILIFNQLPITPSSSLSCSRHGSPLPFTQRGLGFWPSGSANTSPRSLSFGFHTPPPAIGATASPPVAYQISPSPVSGVGSNVDLPQQLGVNEMASTSVVILDSPRSEYTSRNVGEGVAHVQHPEENEMAPTSVVILDSPRSEYTSRDVGEGVRMPGATHLQHPEENVTVADTLISGATMETVCRHFSITDDEITAAYYQERAKSLLAMVLNHRAMSYILVKLQFHDLQSQLKRKVVKLSDDLQLSTEDVLRSFNWSWDSYKHKMTWYSWAEDAARSLQWDQTRPESEATGSDNPVYKIWLGIKYFWGPNGPLTTGSWPERTSGDPEEQAAKSLTQSHIAGNKTSINQSLVKRHST